MTDEVVLTRYLYNHIEVRQTLFISILNHDIDESLYWAYELYYSGLKETFIEFLIDIYLLIYKSDNPEIEKFVMDQIEHLRNEDNDLLLGNIVATLCTRQYDLQKFCKKFLHVDATQINKGNRHKLKVNLTEEYIEQYKTKNEQRIYRTLRNVIKYSIRKDLNKLFNASSNFDYEAMKNIYHNNWLYFTRKCPLWNERIKEHKGIVDDDKKTIVFPNDDQLEEFCEKWNYEPDEQPSNIQNALMGTNNCEYLNIKGFCKKYNLAMKIKKIQK